MQRRESNNNSSPGTFDRRFFFIHAKKRKSGSRRRRATRSRQRRRSFSFFFFRRLFPAQERRRGRNFGEIDGAMYRDDERAPIFPRKSGRNLEKRGDPRKFGSDGSVPWLSLKKFPPASTIILMKMAARDFQPPFFCKKKNKNRE